MRLDRHAKGKENIKEYKMILNEINEVSFNSLYVTKYTRFPRMKFFLNLIQGNNINIMLAEYFDVNNNYNQL